MHRSHSKKRDRQTPVFPPVARFAAALSVAAAAYFSYSAYGVTNTAPVEAASGPKDGSSNAGQKTRMPALLEERSNRPGKEEGMPRLRTALFGPLQKKAEPPQFKDALTTLFWVGEKATRDNGYIGNSESFWDNAWAAHYGGTDDPARRCGFHPCGFTPRENPFYVALPYGERDEAGQLKASAGGITALLISHGGHAPSLKNHWVEIRWGNRSCFAQWEDVGPFEADDFDYVFGGAKKPKNRLGVGAGLDVSPAVWSYLGLTENAVTSWRLVSEAQVPSGPWREIITRSGVTR
jgi:hypothetical protein